MTELIQRYAAALYDLAQTDNMGLTGAAQELLEQEQLWKVLTSSAVQVEEKKELIRSAAPLAGLEPLQAFLCLLAEEGHLDLFPDILEEVHQLELAADGGAVCVMTCAHKPDQAALDDVRRAVCHLRNLDRVVLQVKIDPELLGGFVLEVQGVTYDRSVKGRLERLAKGLEKGASVSESMEELMGSLRDTVKGFQIGQDTSETGRVLEVGDGIATVRGLDRAVYGELVEFDTGVKGMVMDLSRETVGCVLLGREEGTGSVSIEMARLCADGTVYAIEKNEQALALLEKNRESFSASNMQIIPGLAPEACRDLPAPTHAFLGGTSGSVRDILALLLEKNPHVRIVATAVTLESVSALSSCMADFEIAECVSVQVSKAAALGRYHLMQAQNPVYIFTLQNGGTDA